LESEKQILYPLDVDVSDVDVVVSDVEFGDCLCETIQMQTKKIKTD
jgi:hypothetical protein